MTLELVDRNMRQKHARASTIADALGYTCNVINLTHTPMINDHGLDLRVARRNAGLRQCDCAHLLGIHQSRLSKLEFGRTMPSAHECCALSVIYGRSFESLHAALWHEVHDTLSERLATLPECPTRTVDTFNRVNTLNRLAAHLADQPRADAA